MKIRKIIKIHIVSTMLLSAIFLFAGCRADTTGEVQMELNATEEEISNDKGLEKENDRKEESKEKDIANKNDATENQEASFGKIDMYDSVLAEYSDMVQNDFYRIGQAPRSGIPTASTSGRYGSATPSSRAKAGAPRPICTSSG